MKDKVLPIRSVLKTIMKIINQKPGPVIVIKKDSQNTEIFGAIYFLEAQGLIYNLRHIKKKEDKYSKGDIIFAVSNWDALWEYYIKHYEGHVKDPFGKVKQLEIVKKVIWGKAEKLDNKQFTLTASDFKNEERKHILLIPTIEILARSGFLSIEKFGLPPFADVEYSIKLEEKPVRKKVVKKEKIKSEIKIIEKKPEFRFSNGVLFRDYLNNTLIIKNENSNEFQLLRLVFDNPLGERIDTMSDNIDMGFRQIYDTARRLNDKIDKTFNIKDFFDLDYKNKYIKRVVE